MGIIGIDEQLIDPHNMSTAGNLRDNCSKRTDTGFLDNSGFKNAPDNTLVNEFLIELYRTFGM